VQRVETVVGNPPEGGSRGGAVSKRRNAQPSQAVRPHRRGGGHDGRLCARRWVALFIIIFTSTAVTRWM
jgi:hypothetical protein